jgi:hypothetical protein
LAGLLAYLIIVILVADTVHNPVNAIYVEIAALWAKAQAKFNCKPVSRFEHHSKGWAHLEAGGRKRD